MASARFLDPSSIPLKRQSGGNIWATMRSIIQGAIIVGLLVVMGLFFVPVLNTEKHHKERLALLQVQIAAAQEQQRELQIETELMKNSPSYVEHIARDRLNMGRPGETILRFDPYPTGSAAPRTVAPSSN